MLLRREAETRGVSIKSEKKDGKGKTFHSEREEDGPVFRTARFRLDFEKGRSCGTNELPSPPKSISSNNRDLPIRANGEKTGRRKLGEESLLSGAKNFCSIGERRIKSRCVSSRTRERKCDRRVDSPKVKGTSKLTRVTATHPK